MIQGEPRRRPPGPASLLEPSFAARSASASGRGGCGGPPSLFPAGLSGRGARAGSGLLVRAGLSGRAIRSLRPPRVEARHGSIIGRCLGRPRRSGKRKSSRRTVKQPVWNHSYVCWRGYNVRSCHEYSDPASSLRCMWRQGIARPSANTLAFEHTYIFCKPRNFQVWLKLS